MHKPAPSSAIPRSRATSLLRALVRAYQIGISPALPPSCRFVPTCSAYALEALEQHGALAGSYLAARRVLRCHPWCAGGVDAVPAVVKRPAFLTLLPCAQHNHNTKEL